MANCYVCGNSNASYRRYVHTGISQRFGYSSRGGSTSTTNHYGPRSVCAECALKIDYYNKKSSAMTLIFIGVPIGLFLCIFSKLLGAIFITLFIIVGIVKRINAESWYSDQKNGFKIDNTMENQKKIITNHQNSQFDQDKKNACDAASTLTDRILNETDNQKVKLDEFITDVMKKSETIKSRSECEALIDFCEEFSKKTMEWKNILIKEVEEFELLYNETIKNKIKDEIVSGKINNGKICLINMANSVIDVANSAIKQINSQKEMFKE